MIKFSKNLNDIKLIKKNFFSENNQLLLDKLKINRKYKNQKKRIFCKNCNKKIKNNKILNHGIEYSLCKLCGHLNGIYEDTKSFSDWLYSYKDGNNYKSGYVKNYKQRVDKIYIPKVEFLMNTLKKKISLFDIGAGAGHFLCALEKKKIFGYGYDPSISLTNFGNKFLKKNYLINPKNQNLNELIINSKVDVISLIGVLQHLRKQNDIFKLFKKSKAKFLFLSLPLMSFSVIIENIFQNVYPRQLSGGHTHLYTQESIKYILRKFKLKIVGEWWFGGDILDLYRSVLLNLKTNNSKFSKKLLDKYLLSVLNELQHVLDKKKICSEVHLIIKK